MDASVGIPYLMAIKQAGLSQGAVSHILEMQGTNVYFSRLRSIKQSQSQWERKPQVVLSTEKNKNMQRLLVKPTQDF